MLLNLEAKLLLRIEQIYLASLYEQGDWCYQAIIIMVEVGVR